MRCTAIFLFLPTIASAQSLPATHAFSGLAATSTAHRLERDVTRPYGPMIEAGGMPSGSPIRVVRPTFRLPTQELGIADSYDALFFGEARLVRVRVYLKAAGQPLTQRWTDQLRKYFDFLDRDGDGVLNRHEAEFALSNAGVRQMLRTGYAYQRPDDAARTFLEIDLDRDEKLSFDEFAHFYAPSAGQIVDAIPGQSRDPFADQLTDELFKKFDTNKDGKLSRAELTAVEELIASLDSDEDECLSIVEVVPAANQGFVSTTPVTPNPVPVGPQPMLAFKPGAAPDSILDTIYSRYDKDKNLRISRAENPFGDEVFKFLDKNGNGELSVTELIAWKDAAPDLEVELTLGLKPSENSIKLLPTRPVPAGLAFRVTGEGVGLLQVGTQTIQFSSYAPTGVYAQIAVPSFLNFFDNGRGYLTEKDIAGPQFQAFRVLFDMIDRDADGKMTRKEFDAFFALQAGFTRLPLALVYSAQTPNLFQVIDANGDGRLSVREVRDAWSRLIALEPTSKDFVTRAALQPQGAIRFGRTNEASAMQANAFNTRPVRVPNRGPLWFQKFDRNGDGEVSRAEFPGTTAEFDRLDTNKDGLISMEEAQAAEKTLRVRK